MAAKRLEPTKPGDWPEGSRWLHVWAVPAGNPGHVALAFQFEVVAVRISAAPCLIMCASDARRVLDQLASLPNARRDEVGVSIRTEDF